MLHNEEINNLCSSLNREVGDQIEETEMGAGRRSEMHTEFLSEKN
jgi:hypothetical protein